MSIKLRPHHILCLRNFKGHGYSEEFCANMARIKQLLADCPDTKIELVRGHDDICAACPKKNEPCALADEIDARVLASKSPAPQTCCAGCEWILLCE